jgi:multiple sugar transport system substrate-binding protein
VARDDLLAHHRQRAPATWDEVAALAAALPGGVAIPLYPTDAICSLLTLCANLGGPAAGGDFFFSDRDVGEQALALLGRLTPLLHSESLAFNPPRALDRMRDSEEIVYMPLSFGYTNYSRTDAHARPRLRFLDIPSAGRGPVGSVGGAGLAVSSASCHPEEAAAFAAWATGRATQAAVVFPAGGQPASRFVWLDPALDAASGGFFSGTRATIEAAHIRPRAPWWPPFQEEAGHLVARALRERRPPGDTAAELERLYRRHRDGRAPSEV